MLSSHNSSDISLLGLAPGSKTWHILTLEEAEDLDACLVPSNEDDNDEETDFPPSNLGLDICYDSEEIIFYSSNGYVSTYKMVNQFSNSEAIKVEAENLVFSAVAAKAPVKQKLSKQPSVIKPASAKPTTFARPLAVKKIESVDSKPDVKRTEATSIKLPPPPSPIQTISTELDNTALYDTINMAITEFDKEIDQFIQNSNNETTSNNLNIFQSQLQNIDKDIKILENRNDKIVENVTEVMGEIAGYHTSSIDTMMRLDIDKENLLRKQYNASLKKGANSPLKKGNSNISTSNMLRPLDEALYKKSTNIKQLDKYVRNNLIEAKIALNQDSKDKLKMNGSRNSIKSAPTKHLLYKINQINDQNQRAIYKETKKLLNIETTWKDMKSRLLSSKYFENSATGSKKEDKINAISDQGLMTLISILPDQLKGENVEKDKKKESATVTCSFDSPGKSKQDHLQATAEVTTPNVNLQSNFKKKNLTKDFITPVRKIKFPTLSSTLNFGNSFGQNSNEGQGIEALKNMDVISPLKAQAEIRSSPKTSYPSLSLGLDNVYINETVPKPVVEMGRPKNSNVVSWIPENEVTKAKISQNRSLREGSHDLVESKSSENKAFSKGETVPDPKPINASKPIGLSVNVPKPAASDAKMSFSFGTRAPSVVEKKVEEKTASPEADSEDSANLLDEVSEESIKGDASSPVTAKVVTPVKATTETKAQPTFKFGSKSPSLAAPKSSPVGGFSFGKLAVSEDKSKESTKFSFGSASKNSTPISGFSFGKVAESSKDSKESSFPASGFSLGKVDDSSKESKESSSSAKGMTAFSFASKKTTEKEGEKPPSADVTAAATSAFSSFNFGKPSDVGNTSANTNASGFSFGNLSSSILETPKTSKVKESISKNNTNEKESDSLGSAFGGFSFGKKTDENKTENQPKTSIFGQTASVSSSKSPASTGFSFGTAAANLNNSKTDSDSPFGQATKPAVTTTGFSFGNSASGDSKPPFGSSAAGSANSNPFGAKSANTGSAFGTSAFGATSTSNAKASTAFGASPFGNSTATGTGASPFGNSTTTGTTRSSAFSSNTSSGFGSSAFGSKPTNTFGSSAFGSSSSAFGSQLNSNNQNNNGKVFGSGGNTSSGFGALSGGSGFSFGKTNNGGSSAFSDGAFAKFAN